MHALLSRADALAPQIAARADEIETARRLPADLAERMAEAGLFRMIVPEAIGGLEMRVADLSAAIQTIARADASAGWCVMIASTTALNAAYLPRDFAAEVFANPHTITGGVFAPMGKAVPEGESYRVSGRWPWASGSQNCNWLCAGSLIMEEGGPRRLPSGAPDARLMFFPAEEAILHDTWHTSGLKGTGSLDMELRDVRVRQDRSVSLITQKPWAEGPLYAFPAFGLLAVGIASVALGNARAALDDFLALATAKKPGGGQRTLAERATVQADFAKAEAQWQGARCYLEDAIGRTWAEAETAGHLGEAGRANLRLACTHAVRTCADVARVANDLAGGTAVYLASPIQRRFRDAHAACAHVMTAPATYELTGRVMMGVPTDTAML
jgi:indole-3-acetate monooxygenase